MPRVRRVPQAAGWSEFEVVVGDRDVTVPAAGARRRSRRGPAASTEARVAGPPQREVLADMQTDEHRGREVRGERTDHVGTAPAARQWTRRTAPAAARSVGALVGAGPMTGSTRSPPSSDSSFMSRETNFSAFCTAPRGRGRRVHGVQAPSPIARKTPRSSPPRSYVTTRIGQGACRMIRRVASTPSTAA